MTADRPAALFWAKAEEERRTLLAESAARFKRQMLEAGGIEARDLSTEARRTLAWLAEGDRPTVEGVAELLQAARRAGTAGVLARPRGDAGDDIARSGASAIHGSALSLLRQLSTAVPGPARWRAWVVDVDAIGRVTLPLETRRGLDGSSALRAVSRDQALILRGDGPGSGRPVDQRGRLTLPGWLRRLVGPEGSVLVAASVPEAATVVVAPAAVLDELADELAGEVA